MVAEGLKNPLEILQQVTKVLSRDFEAKTQKRLDQVLFVDVRRVTGPSADPTLVVLAAFQTLLYYFISENMEAEYINIFEVQ